MGFFKNGSVGPLSRGDTVDEELSIGPRPMGSLSMDPLSMVRGLNAGSRAWF